MRNIEKATVLSQEDAIMVNMAKKDSSMDSYSIPRNDSIAKDSGLSQFASQNHQLSSI